MRTSRCHVTPRSTARLTPGIMLTVSSQTSNVHQSHCQSQENITYTKAVLLETGEWIRPYSIDEIMQPLLVTENSHEYSIRMRPCQCRAKTGRSNRKNLTGRGFGNCHSVEYSGTCSPMRQAALRLRVTLETPCEYRKHQECITCYSVTRCPTPNPYRAYNQHTCTSYQTCDFPWTPPAMPSPPFLGKVRKWPHK